MTVIPRCYGELKQAVMKGLSEIGRGHQGDHFTVRCKTVAKAAGLRCTPVIYNLVNSVLKELVEQGLIEVYRYDSHGVKYLIRVENLGKILDYLSSK